MKINLDKRYRETLCDICLKDIMWDSHIGNRLEILIVCSECAAKTELIEKKRKRFEAERNC